MQINPPGSVKTVIETLQDNGFEAYAVGGCVRDSYLGYEPHDWDITTNAKPGEVKSLFRRTVDIGMQHGTVKVMMGREGIEVTTYRIDGKYDDSRHPNEVTFTADLREDLRRRDFTVNAMAYSEKTGLVDLFGGVDDLKAGVIRAVGNAEERFSEDALRMLRALRFSARFGYEIEEDTKQAIAKLAPTLSKISAERIREELEKLICSDNPDRLRLAYELGVTSVIFPEWDRMMECDQNNPHHYTDVGDHTIDAIKYAVRNFADIPDEENRILRIALLLHDIAKPVKKFLGDDGLEHFTGHPEEGARMAEDVLKRLKYDNNTIIRVKKLVRYHDEIPALTFPGVRRFIVEVGLSNMDALLLLKEADLYAHTKYRWDEKAGNNQKLDMMYRKIVADRDCLAIRDMKIDGNDLISRGIKPGPAMGEILQKLFETVLDDPAMNDHEILMEALSGMI